MQVSEEKILQLVKKVVHLQTKKNKRELFRNAPL